MLVKGGIVLGEQVANGVPHQIGATQGDEGHIRAQTMQGDARIGDGAPQGPSHGADFVEQAGLTPALGCKCADVGDDIEAEMAGHGNTCHGRSLAVLVGMC